MALLSLQPARPRRLAVAALVPCLSAVLQAACGGSAAPAAAAGAADTVQDGVAAQADASAAAKDAPATADATAAVDPCTLGVGATGSQLKKKVSLPDELPTGGIVKAGRYQLVEWGQKSTPIEYTLEMQLKLKLGTTNYWQAAQYWGSDTKQHIGGGTFTIDEAGKQLTFVKTCGETAIDNQALPLKTGYSVMSTGALRLTNVAAVGAAGEAILVFGVPK